jgi:hypothetical protein
VKSLQGKLKSTLVVVYMSLDVQRSFSQRLVLGFNSNRGVLFFPHIELNVVCALPVALLCMQKQFHQYLFGVVAVHWHSSLKWRPNFTPPSRSVATRRMASASCLLRLEVNGEPRHAHAE